VPTAWGSGTWGSGAWGGLGETLTGVEAQGAVGSVAGQSITVALTGVLCHPDVGGVDPFPNPEIQEVHANGYVGTMIPEVIYEVAISGVSASGAVGTVSADTAENEDGVIAYGNTGTAAPETTVALSGVSATGAVDTVIYTRGANITGVAANGAVGSVSEETSVALSGVGASGAVGSVTASTAENEDGVVANGAVGSVGSNITVALSGVSASGDVGTAVFNWQAGSVEATGSVGTVSTGERTVALTGVAGQGLIGYEDPDKAVAISGVSASGAAGNVAVGERLVAVTGCQAMGNVGNFGVFYWSLIDDAQNANWTLVNTE
jgi:hypothetical protein